MTVPEAGRRKADVESSREREALLKVHEVAAAWFKAQLAAPVGAPALRVLRERGMTPGDDRRSSAWGLRRLPAACARGCSRKDSPTRCCSRAACSCSATSGQSRDRFRNRLMIPICRDNGAIIAFGGRAMEDGQQPKYLNSPETAIYVKGRTLYGLHLGKQAISRLKYAVLVEGYFDWAQAYQAGIHQRRRVFGHRADPGAG